MKANKQKTFKQLFNDHHDWVYNVCYRMSGSRAEAEDITQDVFVKIFHSIEKFRGEAKLSSWIYRITVNTCLKKQRRKKLENLMSLEFMFQDKGKTQLPSPDHTPDQQVEISEKEQIVQRAIHQLSERQKTALILQRYEELSYDEIAAIMDISLSAVESLLRRAKENLAKILIHQKKDLL
ncbi:MAG: RNA polymerase sigma factor [candidate division KSB1 bacterium]|nr:RNA polymerase sigma factor [candidate division KSB1 bacterium]